MSDRPDPSDFTGGTKSTEEEVEEAAEELEPSDNPDGPFWTAKRKVKSIGGGLASKVPGYGPGDRSSAVDSSNGNNGGDNGYDDGSDEPEDEDRRIFLYAIGALGAGGVGAIAADGADGEVDGEFEAFERFDGLGATIGNQTETPTPSGQETPYDTPEVDETPTEQPTPNPTETPQQGNDTIYFNNLSDLPDEACYREEGGVSGYFEASDIENVLGEEVTAGLNPSQGDIAYDVDFRDSDGDGEGDAYVMQLAGTDSQNDLTVEQAETLFEELDVDGSYC